MLSESALATPHPCAGEELDAIVGRMAAPDRLDNFDLGNLLATTDDIAVGGIGGAS